MVHTLPLNKLFLFFPGIKNNNECDKGYLKDRKAITYAPQIKYNLINSSTNPVYGTDSYIILLLIAILILLIIFGTFYLINKKKVN
jgi:hypothetical protein